MALNRDQECGLDLSHRDSLFASLTPGGIGAEIGVDWGDYSRRIMELAKPTKLFLIDCWQEQPVETYGHDPANSQQDIKYRQCLERYLLDDRYRIVKAFSPEIASVFQDEYFDWVFEDSNHLLSYENAVAWFPKVKPGGWYLCHDFCDAGDTNGRVGDYITTREDMTRWAAEYKQKFWLTRDDGAYKCFVTRKP